MLLLFDIDATLLKTSGVGIKAILDAGRELHGERFTADGIETAGRLDPLIIADMLRRSGLECSRPAIERVRAAYHRHLERWLKTPGAAYALPGVHALIAELRRRDLATLGLLTGNYPETGRMKLAACGIDERHFHVQVWGDESPFDPPARDHLPPLGLGKYRARHARDLPAAHATIIGDTPHDVRCAKAHGLRALGVATGPFSVDQLMAAGADRAVESLSDTPGLSRWLLSAGPASA